MELEALRESALFRGLSADEIGAALRALGAVQRSFDKGQHILRAGEPVKWLGLMVRGSALIERTDPAGLRTVIGTVEAGDTFAEPYAILGGTLPVDVTAREQCAAVMLDIEKLWGMEERWAGRVTENLTRLSMERTRRLLERSLHTSPKSVRGRVLSYLTALSQEQGTQDIDIPFDRQQMADYLNIDRTALSKELSRMKNEGLIDYWKNHFRLLEARN